MKHKTETEIETKKIFQNSNHGECSWQT